MYTNYIVQKKKFKEHKKKFKKPNFKAFKLQIFISQKKNINLKNKSNKFGKKQKKEVCFLLLCDISKLICFLSLKKT